MCMCRAHPNMHKSTETYNIFQNALAIPMVGIMTPSEQRMMNVLHHLRYGSSMFVYVLSITEHIILLFSHCRLFFFDILTIGWTEWKNGWRKIFNILSISCLKSSNCANINLPTNNEWKAVRLKFYNANARHLLGLTIKHLSYLVSILVRSYSCLL